MMSFEAYIAVIINGICIGGVYGLMSSAWSFQCGALKYANFAYGASIMVSMYLTYYMLAVWNVPIYLAVPLILLYNALFGLFMRKTVLRRKVYSTMILATMGMQLILTNLATMICTAYPRNLTYVMCFVLALVVMLSFQMFLKKTWTGRAIRAVVQNPEAAAMMGIDGEKIVSIAYSLSYSLIGIAAIILMTMFQVEPTFGGKLQTYAFLICVAAGIGNISGALWSGILVGVLSSLISSVLPSAFHDAVIFTLFVIILLVRPHGLFTKKDSLAHTI